MDEELSGYLSYIGFGEAGMCASSAFLSRPCSPKKAQTWNPNVGAANYKKQGSGEGLTHQKKMLSIKKKFDSKNQEKIEERQNSKFYC